MEEQELYIKIKMFLGERMDVKRIVIARTDKIGDLVLSIPSFFMLRKMYPQADISILVRNCISGIS